MNLKLLTERFREYEKKVTDLLRKEIVPRLRNGQKIQTQYLYARKLNVYDFDLVVLDDKENISEIYEIITYNAYKSNFNYIKNKLQRYKDDISAKVFIAYLNDNAQLQVESLEDIKKERKGHNKSISSVEAKEIESFSEYYEAIKQICDASDLQYFFRGHSKYDYESIPSIFRKRELIKHEHQMYHDAVRKNPSEFTEDMSTFDKLVKMQHYGLPTRLLDITTNPLVALYFACKEKPSIDGAVLIFSMQNEQIKYFDSDSVCVISNLAKRPIDFSFDKDKDSFVGDILQDISGFNGDRLESEATKVVCVMPKLNNDRIIRQYGAFFVFGMGRTKDCPAQFEDEPIKLRIKADCKKKILEELQILGIDDASLFPEIDKVMEQIKSEYSK